MQRFYKTVVVSLLSLSTVVACQSSPLKDYQSLHHGMEKDDVLGIMGSPQRTQRFHGKDRWTYVFYDNKLRYEKEVQFFEGNAIYVGDPWQPEISAAQVDAKNEVSNKAIEDDLIQKYENNSAEYTKYENDVRGNDKIRYVPQFKPLR